MFHDTEKYENRACHPKRGFGLFDTLLALTVSMAIYTNYISMQQESYKQVVSDNISSTMKKLRSAGEQWIRDNSSKAMESMADGQVVAIPMSGTTGAFNGTGPLFQGDDIPDNYQAGLPYGQKLAYLVKRVPATGTTPAHLESLITAYGGQGMDNRLLGLAAEKLGATAGAVMYPYNKVGTPSQGTLSGAYGGWSYPSGYWSSNLNGADTTPLTGHVAMIGNSYGGIVTEYLSRYAGVNEEANRMHTDMDLNSNSVTTVNTVNGVKNGILQLGSVQNANNVVMPRNLTVCDQSHDGCGIQLNTSTSLVNDADGWTSLRTGSSGLYIPGGSRKSGYYPSMRVETGTYLGQSSGDENNHPSGVVFNYNATGAVNGIGAHLFQSPSSMNLLTLTGNNGFTGLDISPRSETTASIQILRNLVYADNGGNLHLQVPAAAGGTVDVEHNDANLSDLAANAINLGQSLGMAQDGGTYPAESKTDSDGAIIGGHCTPNGRIATSTDGSGTLMACINFQWYNQGISAFSKKVYSGSASGYTRNNTDTTQIIVMTYNMNNRGGSGNSNDTAKLYLNINGQNVCQNHHDERMKRSETHGYARTGAYTCTAIVPPHATVDYQGTLLRTCSCYKHCNPLRRKSRYGCSSLQPWSSVYGVDN